MFIAFSIEAYLNSLGARVIKFWDQLERLPWRSKIEIHHQLVNRQADWGQEPLQFAAEVFKLRDKLAHGKPELVLGPVCTSSDEARTYLGTGELDPTWFKDITPEWCKASQARFRSLMVYLGDLHSFPDADHLLISTGGVRMVEE